MITGAETTHLWLRPGAIFLEGQLPIAEADVAAELGMRDDQVVKALLQAQPEALKLNLRGALIDVPKELAAAWRDLAGETLNFRTQLLADGRVILRPLQAAPLATPAPPAAGSVPAEAALAGRLTQLSLRQPNVEALLQLLSPAALDELVATLPQPELRAALQTWMRLRPSMATLSAEHLRQLVQRSGWMTESLLAQGAGVDFLDLKATLRLLLRKATLGGEKVALLSDAVDEIESRQLAALDTAGGRDGFVSFVLPFADAAPVAIKFSRGRPLAEHEAPPLVIDLHTRNQDLGEIWLQTRITHGKRIDLVMWARREQTALAAQSRSGQLASTLRDAGLEVTRLQVIHGIRESEATPWVAPEAGSMVDIKT